MRWIAPGGRHMYSVGSNECAPVWKVLSSTSALGIQGAALMNPVYGETATVPYAPNLGSYPVDVQFPVAESANRFWAIPVIGLTAKIIILLPHVIILTIFELLSLLLNLVLWVPVLVTGQYPRWGHTFIGGTVLWRMRYTSFLFGLTDAYPAFSLSDPGNGREAVILFQAQPSYSRFFAIPVLGGMVRALMLIPHLIILSVLSYLVLAVMLFTWIPVLSNGQYPNWGRTIVGGYLRWTTRYYMYRFGLADKYPPFRWTS